MIEGRDRGQLRIFFDVAALSGEVVLSAADRILGGEEVGGRFGTVAATPRLDFDGDGDDALLVGGAGLDARETGLRSAAGRVYLIDERCPREIPKALPLGNRQLTGGGFFLVDRGTGRPDLFQDPADVLACPRCATTPSTQASWKSGINSPPWATVAAETQSNSRPTRRMSPSKFPLPTRVPSDSGRAAHFRRKEDFTQFGRRPQDQEPRRRL